MEDLDVDEGLALVNFMARSAIGYFWPRPIDSGWEPIVQLGRHVTRMDLNEARSSQRVQFFDAVF